MTHILKARGSFKAHGDKLKAREGEPVPVAELSPDPPDWMTKRQKDAYRRLVGLCYKGVLSEVDALIVEHGACLYAKLLEMKWDCTPAIMVRFESVLASLGMTPADRSRVKQNPAIAKNPFSNTRKPALAASDGKQLKPKPEDDESTED